MLFYWGCIEMRLSDYTVELKFLKNSLLEEGLARTSKEAEKLAREWLEGIEDPLA